MSRLKQCFSIRRTGTLRSTVNQGKLTTIYDVLRLFYDLQDAPVLLQRYKLLNHGPSNAVATGGSMFEPALYQRIRKR